MFGRRVFFPIVAAALATLAHASHPAVANVNLGAPALPAGAHRISAAKWDAMSAAGQLGTATTYGKAYPIPHAESPRDEPEDEVAENDGKTRTIHFISEADLTKDAERVSTIYDTAPNRAAIKRIVEQSTSLASAAPRAVSQFGKEAPTGTGCKTDTIGWGDGSDIGGNKHDDTYSDIGLHKNFDYPLKAFTPCVKDQAKRGTCTQFATLGAAEELIAEKYGKFVDLSEQATSAQDKIFWDPSLTGVESEGTLLANSVAGYVIPFEKAWDYNGARKAKKANPPGVPAGATATDTCTGYHEFCSNTSGEGKYVCATLKPGQLSCAFASQVPAKHGGVQVLSYVALYDKSSPSTGFDNTIAFLKMGYPIIFGGNVRDHFNGGKTGYIPAPSSTTGKFDGHAFNIVGYVSNDELKAKVPSAPQADGGGYFIVRNSWGLSYGDRGFGYMPMAWALKYVNSSVAIVDAQLNE